MTLKQRLTLISLSLTTLLLYCTLISHSNNKNNNANTYNNPYTLEVSENTERLINTLISSKDKFPEEIIAHGLKNEYLTEKKLELTNNNI